MRNSALAGDQLTASIEVHLTSSL